MALKVYKKGNIAYRNKPIEEKPVELRIEKHYRKVYVGDLVSSFYNGFINYLTLSRIAGLLVPAFLIVSGVYVLYKQLWPEFQFAVGERYDYFDEQNIPLVAGDYIEERQLALSNPGAQYFEDLKNDAISQHVLMDDLVSKSYRGRFSISIPSLNLSNLPVEANVDSSKEEIYDRVLTSALAHMEGTSLPISNIENNMVVYGHSARGDYYQNVQDVAGAFSRLYKINLGDEITLEIDGQLYTYQVNKKQVVDPSDVSIITGTPNKKTLTLFTCHPPGNPAFRMVVTAKPIK